MTGRGWGVERTSLSDRQGLGCREDIPKCQVGVGV